MPVYTCVPFSLPVRTPSNPMLAMPMGPNGRPEGSAMAVKLATCFLPFQNTELSLPVPSNVSATCCHATFKTEVMKTTAPPFGLALKRDA